MSCEGNFRSYCQWLLDQSGNKVAETFGSAEAALAALDRIFQAGRRQPLPSGPQRQTATNLSEVATRALFLQIRSAGLQAPTHTANGLPKRDAQRGYAAVWFTLQAIENRQPLPPLAADVRRQLMGRQAQSHDQTGVFQPKEATALRQALLDGINDHPLATGGVVIDPGAQRQVEVAVSAALATQIQATMRTWRSALKQLLDDPYVLPLVMTRPWRDEPPAVQLQLTVGALLRRWAAELTERDALTTVLQQVVMDTFTVSDSAALPTDDVFKARKVRTLQVHRPLLTALVKAQYTLTQQWFQEQDITHVSVWRGMRVVANQAMAFRADDFQLTTVTMRPMSSTTTEREIAEHFATKRTDGVGVLGAVRVSVNQVISTCRTGIGTLNELEVIVLGGPYQMLARRMPNEHEPQHA